MAWGIQLSTRENAGSLENGWRLCLLVHQVNVWRFLSQDLLCRMALREFRQTCGLRGRCMEAKLIARNTLLTKVPVNLGCMQRVFEKKDTALSACSYIFFKQKQNATFMLKGRGKKVKYSLYSLHADFCKRSPVIAKYMPAGAVRVT